MNMKPSSGKKQNDLTSSFFLPWFLFSLYLHQGTLNTTKKMKIYLTNLEICITSHKRWNKNIKSISCKNKKLLYLCMCQCFDKKLSWHVTVLSVEEGSYFFEDTNRTSLYEFLLFVDCPLWKFCSSKTNQKYWCQEDSQHLSAV